MKLFDRELSDLKKELNNHLKNCHKNIFDFDCIDCQCYKSEIQGVESCRVCGCTDFDCRECIRAQGFPCHWVEPDLCSRCEKLLSFDGWS